MHEIHAIASLSLALSLSLCMFVCACDLQMLNQFDSVR